MLPRQIRTVVAGLAALGLVGALAAVPALAQSCTAEEPITEDVTDGVTLKYDADFVCTDAADAGDWTITVSVSNDSDADVTVDDITLSHATPPFGEEEDNSVDVTTLPLVLAPGEDGTFDVSGVYTLAGMGEDGLVNLHLRAGGTATGADESAPFILGINVHLLGPGAELDDAEGDGRPSWVPGPPPWVRAMIAARFPDGPFGLDGFPPAGNADATDGSDEATASEPFGPPAWVPLPPPTSDGGDGAAGGAPSWVGPGGPPAWVPVGGDDEEGGPPAGAGRS